jgi:hypothetical protein
MMQEENSLKCRYKTCSIWSLSDKNYHHSRYMLTTEILEALVEQSLEPFFEE